MPQIGTFHRTPNGFEGRIHTLGLDVDLVLAPADAGDAENAPDWRIRLGGVGDGAEVGAAWNRTGEKAGAYFALLIDCPMLAQPIRANLFQSGQQGDVHHLLWSRPAPRDGR